MDIRILKYFMTLCETGTVTAAAKVLNITQPALSRQLSLLEDELGGQLFTRDKRGIQLTEAGVYLYKHALEIVNLTERTISEFPKTENTITGDLRIGAGESPSIIHTVKIIKMLRENYPDIHIHFYNVGSRDVQARMMENGIIDFALLSVVPLTRQYAHIKLPVQDTWGLLMRKDDPMSEKGFVEPSDMKSIPLVSGRSENFRSMMSGWLGFDFNQLNYIGTSFLMTSTEKLVEEKVAYAIIREGIINDGITSPVCFRPFYPELKSNMFLAWPNGANLTASQELFLNAMKEWAVGEKT